MTVLEADQTRLGVAYRLYVAGITSADATALWQRSVTPVQAALPRIDRDAGGRSFRFRRAVRSYELGPDGSVRPQVILQWLEHAIVRAANRAGCSHERMVAAGFLTFVVGHHLVLGEPAHEGDELFVTSRLVELRRVSGIWHHEIHGADGALVAADRAEAPSSISRVASSRLGESLA